MEPKLAQLNGSEKQVQWANDIRIEALGQMEKAYPNPLPGGYEKIVSVFNLEVKAEWWISNRSLFFKKIVSEIAKAYPEAKQIMK